MPAPGNGGKSSRERFKEQLSDPDAWDPGSFISSVNVLPSLYDVGARKVVNLTMFRPFVADVNWFRICFALDMQKVMARFLEGKKAPSTYSTMVGIILDEPVSADSYIHHAMWQL